VSLLEVEGLEAGYGDLVVLRDVSFAVEEGQVAAILGPNGAGKTTTLRAVSGILRPSGRVTFDGNDLVGRKPEAIARLGIAHVPEGRGTFAELSVEDNLRVGAYLRRDADGVTADLDRCFGYFPRLRERRGDSAGNLSGGEQQMLAVARGLMLRPRLILLDEPSLGLAPVLTKELFRILAEIAREQNTTMLVVEQNANLVLGLADYAYVLEAGQIVLDGDAEQMRGEDAVRHAYLGN
jgi:branched-chain amino acid transport system ATP-binding protein